MTQKLNSDFISPSIFKKEYSERLTNFISSHKESIDKIISFLNLYKKFKDDSYRDDAVSKLNILINNSEYKHDTDFMKEMGEYINRTVFFEDYEIF